MDTTHDEEVADASKGANCPVPAGPLLDHATSPVEGAGNGKSGTAAGINTPARILLLLVLGAILAQAAYQWLQNIAVDLGPKEGVYDLSVYYAAALALRGNPHANIFNPDVLRAAAAAHSTFLMPVATLYLYPPLLAILIIPLTYMPFIHAAHLWTVVNLALWLATTVLLISLVRYEVLPSSAPLIPRVSGFVTALRRRHVMRRFVEWLTTIPDVLLLAGALTIFLSFTSSPLHESVTLGQVTPLVFFLTVCAPWLERRGQAKLCGALLAFAALIKVFPIVLIGYYLLRGRWRVVLGAAVAFAVLIAGMTAVVGVQGVLATHAILTNGISSGAQFQNEALARVPFWLGVLVGHHSGTPATIAGYALIALVALAFVAGVLAYAWRYDRSRDRRFDASSLQGEGAHELVGYGWALCTMILVSPVTWEHHLAWALPAFLFALWYVARELLVEAQRGLTRPAMIGILLALALIVGYALISQELSFGYDGRVPFDPSPYIFHHIPVRPFFMIERPLGVLLIWGVSGYLFLRRHFSVTASLASAIPPEARVEAGYHK